MASKGKKENGKKTNGEGGGVFDTKIPMFNIDVNKVETAIGLLESSEENILVLSTCAVDNFISKYGHDALAYLLERGVLPKIVDNLLKHPTARLMSLKLIVRLLHSSNTLPKLQQEKKYISNLTYALLAAEDVVEIEYVAYVLSISCKDFKCAEQLVRDDVIDKLFKNLVFYVDEDIKNNCLKVLLDIVNCYKWRQKIASSPAFQLGILYKIIEGPFPSLRPATVQIIRSITDWEDPSFQQQLFDSNTIQILFSVLCEEQWTNTHNDALSGIYNLLRYNPAQLKCLESKVFLKFVNIATTSSQDHALACMALIQQLIAEDINLQVLMDFRIYEQLPDLCRFNDDIVYVKFCEVICTFCENCFMIPKLANAKVIKEVERLMRKKDLPWLPYRQSGIRPLHIFMMSDPKLAIIFFQTGVIYPIMEAVVSRYELDSCNYKMILEIFQSLICNKSLHSYMWNFEIYEQFVTMLTDDSADIILIALDVLQRTFYSEKYREWFLEKDGFESVSQLLCRRSCTYIDRVIAFCKFAAKYDGLNASLLRHGFIPVFEDLAIGYPRQKAICDIIVNDIYRCELSIKFFKKSYLDFEDLIKNGFCMYANFRPRSFPPIVVDDVEKLCYSCTMLTVNFHGGKRTKIPVAMVNEGVVGSAHSLDSEDYSEASNTTHSTREIIYKKVLPEAVGEPKTDYYLKKYLKRVKALITKDGTSVFARKISILANFVVHCLSGFEDALPSKHQYETHINELKKKLRSNYIPLGYIRIGTMAERALLFKVLADNLGIPCALRRDGDFCIWNEVVLYKYTPTCVFPGLPVNYIQECIVDLMCNVGKLLLKGDHNTQMYCKNSDQYQPEYILSSENSEPTTSVMSRPLLPCYSGTNTSDQSQPELPTFEIYSPEDWECEEEDSGECYESEDGLALRETIKNHEGDQTGVDFTDLETDIELKTDQFSQDYATLTTDDDYPSASSGKHYVSYKTEERSEPYKTDPPSVSYKTDDYYTVTAEKL